MKKTSNVFLTHTHAITPLGSGIDINFKALVNQQSGIQLTNDSRFFHGTIPLAKINDDVMDAIKQTNKVYTDFDALVLQCVHDIMQSSSTILSSPETIIFLSTTKGNIQLMENNAEDERLLLSYSANLIQQKCNNPNVPIIISNACISGLSAIITASRLLHAGTYKHALVIGCDVLSAFVIKGFNSFHAISKEPCRPFDKTRNGITLGEACAACILSTEIESDIVIGAGRIANDANHISGPSKTGEELAHCIHEVLLEHQLNASNIDAISAHGTATEYNDEMEAKAIALAGLQKTPVFSLKPNYGHTLGAAGILETIFTAECLQQGVVLPSLGYHTHGVSENIFVNEKLLHKSMHYGLKTASGFGGCNAALLIEKVG